MYLIVNVEYKVLVVYFVIFIIVGTYFIVFVFVVVVSGVFFWF